MKRQPLCFECICRRGTVYAPIVQPVNESKYPSIFNSTNHHLYGSLTKRSMLKMISIISIPNDRRISAKNEVDKDESFYDCSIDSTVFSLVRPQHEQIQYYVVECSLWLSALCSQAIHHLGIHTRIQHGNESEII